MKLRDALMMCQSSMSCAWELGQAFVYFSFCCPGPFAREVAWELAIENKTIVMVPKFIALPVHTFQCWCHQVVVHLERVCDVKVLCLGHLGNVVFVVLRLLFPTWLLCARDVRDRGGCGGRWQA